MNKTENTCNYKEILYVTKMNTKEVELAIEKLKQERLEQAGEEKRNLFEEIVEKFNDIKKELLLLRSYIGQECQVCNASWSIPEKMKNCPFCGADLNGDEKVESIEKAFQIIVKKHGHEVFNGDKNLLLLLEHYAPDLAKERNLIRIAIESGAYQAIYATSKISKSIQESAVMKYKKVINEEYFIDKTWAEKVLRWCLDILERDDRKKVVNKPEVLPKRKFEEVGVKKSGKGWFIDVKDTLTVTSVEVEESLEQTTKRKNDWENVTTLIIGEGITEIPKGYFEMMKKLEHIKFPTTLRKIGVRGFTGCSSLETVEIPEGLEVISKFAFQFCIKLRDIKFPESLSKIEIDAFYGCYLKTTYVSESCIVFPGNKNIIVKRKIL